MTMHFNQALVRHVDAVLVRDPAAGEAMPCDRDVELWTREGKLVFRTSLPILSAALPADHVLTGEAVLAELCDGLGCFDTWLLSFRPKPLRMLDHVPYAACPVAGVVRRFRRLVNRIRTPVLSELIDDVFGDPEVFRYFWTCPASIRHHHSHPGGLAEHSVGTAERAAACTSGQSEHRDLAVTEALLHDIGKVWSYEDGRLTPEAKRLGHEAVGYRRLMPHVERMHEASPRLARELIADLWPGFGRDSPQRSAVGRITRACDGFDAATARLARD